MTSSHRIRAILFGLATLALAVACAPDRPTSPAALGDAAVSTLGTDGTTPPPEVCKDPYASNYGGPLPCVYPPKVCKDTNASNYGEPLPCVYPPPPPPTDKGNGCTPGYWKQTQHFGSWVGYTPNQDFDTVFGVDAFDPNLTLLQALSNGGGGIDALGRHAVAALLNSSNPQVGNGMTPAQVIALVQNAINSGSASTIEATKNLLAALNERRCPLGRNP